MLKDIRYLERNINVHGEKLTIITPPDASPAAIAHRLKSVRPAIRRYNAERAAAKKTAESWVERRLREADA